MRMLTSHFVVRDGSQKSSSTFELESDTHLRVSGSIVCCHSFLNSITRVVRYFDTTARPTMQQHYWTTVLLVTALLWLEVAATTRPKRSVWSGRSTTTNNDDDKGKKEESFVELEPSTPCSSGYSDRALLSVARAATLSRGSSSPFVRSSAAFLLLGDSGLVTTSSRSSATASACSNDENDISSARRYNTIFQGYNRKGDLAKSK